MPQFSVIKDRIRDYVLDLPTETDALIDRWVNKAVEDAERRFNFSHMRVTTEYTTTAGQRVLTSKPSDWKEVRVAPWIREDDGDTYEIAWAPSESEMIRRFSLYDADDDGDPQFLLEKPNDIEIFPFPDGNADWSDGEYRINIPYWGYSAALVNDGDTNWFTDNAEDYLTFFAAGEGMLFNRDTEEGALMKQRAEGEFTQLKRVQNRSKLSRRVTLRPRRDVYGPAKGVR